MHSTLIVARMDLASSAEVGRLFAEFDQTDMPHRMGTRRRQLFAYNGLYFHLQDFDTDTQTQRRVSFPQEGDLLSSATGRVVMAPPGQHLVLQGGRFHLTRDPERHSCRPSVDVLFESMAKDCGPTSAACLLTGMGRDGATGLLALRRAGAFTIAQDEASCVVYGMPREAVILNAAQRVLPLGDIASVLARLNPRSPGGRP